MNFWLCFSIKTLKHLDGLDCFINAFEEIIISEQVISLGQLVLKDDLIKWTCLQHGSPEQHFNRRAYDNVHEHQARSRHFMPACNQKNSSTPLLSNNKKLFAFADKGVKALANTTNAFGHCWGDISKTSFVVCMCLASLPACQICFPNTSNITEALWRRYASVEYLTGQLPASCGCFSQAKEIITSKNVITHISEVLQWIQSYFYCYKKLNR